MLCDASRISSANQVERASKKKMTFSALDSTIRTETVNNGATIGR